METAPPIGLTPKFIRDQQRAMEIVLAISRFVEAGQKVPRTWLNELTELCGEAE